MPSHTTKVAVIHDWLGPMTGAEQVLEQVLIAYPGADVYTAVDFLADEHRHVLGTSRVFTSFIQRLPGARDHYWNYIPLMPFAFEQFDLEAYDLVISCSHTVAKGVIVHPHQVHVCYLMSPMRFAWDLQPLYLRAFNIERGVRSVVARAAFHWMRTWDAAASARVDAFVSASRYVARRAELAYRRESAVVYPPCDVDFFTPIDGERGDYYLAASRLTPFKRLDLLIEAFREMPSRRLLVAGDGPERVRLAERCTPNITMLGRISNAALRERMRGARAFLFAPPEDFGIVMVEAQACGTPVIAYGRGGAAEIVRDAESPEPTGILFAEQTPAAVCAAVEQLEVHFKSRITPDACRANAMRFTPERFRSELVAQVDAAVARYGGRG